MSNLNQPVISTTKTHALGDLSDETFRQLVERAEEADRADHELTIRQAIVKYQKAVFWAMFLSLALVMEGYDVVTIRSFYGQAAFINRFGEVQSNGVKAISASWQSGLSNGAVVGEMIGLVINGWAQDRFGCRPTYLVALVWMIIAIFVPVFANSLPALVAGEILCGTAWGVFQILSTAYASEVVPTCLRPFVTAWVCCCWGIGILISSGVARAVIDIDPKLNLGWQLPFILQWVWPVPLIIGAWFAPESPWNSVRRGQLEEARNSIRRLRQSATTEVDDVESVLAYIVYTTQVEEAETSGSTYLDCFKRTNLRRTEISIVTWCAQIWCGNPFVSFAVVFLQQAGFSQTASFNINIVTVSMIVIGCIISWFLMVRIGRRTLYMTGLAAMFVVLIVTGALGLHINKTTSTVIGALLVVLTFFESCTVSPVCYPIVAETPSGKLRAKTVTVGRFLYNISSLIANALTPRMLSPTAWNWGAKAGFFYAGTNAMILTWCYFRLPETKDRSFGEIDLLFENRVSARKFSSTTVDQFANVRGGNPTRQTVPSLSAMDEKMEFDHVEKA